jgi:hypothetical protein
MAKRTQRRTQGPSGRSNADALSSFLASVDRFVETVSAQGLAAAPAGEQQLIIRSTGESLVAQTRKLTDFIRESAGGISAAQRRELDQFLRIQDGEAMVERALPVSGQVLSGGAGPVTLGFFSWLDENIHTLKKIIEEILILIFGDVPSWWEIISLIIDELINLLKTLLGGVFGLRMSEVADEGSRAEVNFLREMAAVAALRAARGSRRAADDEGLS